jgi:hypothetical protein
MGFDGSDVSKPVHAVLLDIDHSPSHWLNPGNGAFYTVQGLRDLADKIHPGGIFAMWSNDPPDQAFIDVLETVFHSVDSPVITFPNPYTRGESTATIYVAHKA